jgi:hypothetical protein
LPELDVIEANRRSRLTRLRQHLFRLDSHHAPGRSDAMGRDEAIKAGPLSHIDDRLAIAQRSKQQWVRYPSE